MVIYVVERFPNGNSRRVSATNLFNSLEQTNVKNHLMQLSVLVALPRTELSPAQIKQLLQNPPTGMQCSFSVLHNNHPTMEINRHHGSATSCIQFGCHLVLRKINVKGWNLLKMPMVPCWALGSCMCRMDSLLQRPCNSELGCCNFVNVF